jgi:hypothetical protein
MSVSAVYFFECKRGQSGTGTTGTLCFICSRTWNGLVAPAVAQSVAHARWFLAFSCDCLQACVSCNLIICSHVHLSADPCISEKHTLGAGGRRFESGHPDHFHDWQPHAQNAGDPLASFVDQAQPFQGAAVGGEQARVWSPRECFRYAWPSTLSEFHFIYGGRSGWP